jgi:serine/threonine protein kinase
MGEVGPNSLVGEYVIERELGRGGMSIVFLGRHRLMSRMAAIKLMRPRSPQSGADAHFLARLFRREIEASAAVDHPNVLTVFDAGFASTGDPYLVMEHANYGDLGTRIAGGGLHWRDALRFTRQAAVGLQAIHDVGIVHRDVKPANLLLCRSDHVKIADFGLCLFTKLLRLNTTERQKIELDPATQGIQATEFVKKFNDTGASFSAMSKSVNPSAQAYYYFDSETQLTGTSEFAAPEAWTSSRIDWRADIYSLGVTLFHLLTGRRIFEDPLKPHPLQYEDLLRIKRETPIPSLVDLSSDVPPTPEKVFRRMVAVDADERFQSMSEVTAALDTVRANPRVFLCYRRDDSLDATDRLFRELLAVFGRESVFMDIDSIPGGADFPSQIRAMIERCDVMLAMVGDHWLWVADERGRRRLDDIADYVRQEIEAALAARIPLIPVLVGRARMPKREDLPNAIAQLAFHNAVEVRSGPTYSGGVSRLVQVIVDAHAGRDI